MERFETEAVRQHFDSIASRYDEGKARQTRYWRCLLEIYGSLVPRSSSVLEVGCGTGALLASLAPKRGVGLDLSPAMVEEARKRHPGLEFRAEDIAHPSGREVFDHILLCDVIEHLPDPGAALEGLKAYAGAGTRLVLTSVNPVWTKPLHLAEALGLKLPEGEHEWLALSEVRGLVAGHGFRVELAEGRILLPFGVPLADAALNRLAKAPMLHGLCFVYAVVFRLA
ncbi:MAG: methyltransferase domain-containing protein [Elusimicrobia bacterium]|nr:methyltransferase domain-containing protein [Elusimicrobiota bacterium]